MKQYTELPDLSRIFVPSQMPKGGKCRAAFVAEAPGFSEANRKTKSGRRIPAPLVGPSGKVFDRWLEFAGVARDECYVGNVFSYRPKDNEVARFFVKKSEAKKSGWVSESALPPFGSTGYVAPERISDVGRMRAELEEVEPEIIVALGGAALWALTGNEGIKKYRGVLLETWWDPSIPVLATWHPAAVMRQWNLLPQAVADVSKAIRIINGEFKELERTLYIEPTLEDLDWFYDKYIAPLRDNPKEVLSVDVETVPYPTSHRQVTCIGFAPSSQVSLVVPFWDQEKEGWHYWPKQEQEVAAIMWCKKILEDPRIRKVGQNFAQYDVPRLKENGIKVKGRIEDTMLAHYCLEPELLKDLGLLASLYTNSSPWKQTMKLKGLKEGKKDA